MAGNGAVEVHGLVVWNLDREALLSLIALVRGNEPTEEAISGGCARCIDVTLDDRVVGWEEVELNLRSSRHIDGRRSKCQAVLANVDGCSYAVIAATAVVITVVAIVVAVAVAVAVVVAVVVGRGRTAVACGIRILRLWLTAHQGSIITLSLN